MLCYAASHLGLYCLPMSHKKDARLIWVKNIIASTYAVDTMKYDDSFEWPHNNNFCEAGPVSISRY